MESVVRGGQTELEILWEINPIGESIAEPLPDSLRDDTALSERFDEPGDH